MKINLKILDKAKKILTLSVVVLGCAVCLNLLTACQTTDKKESYFNSGYFSDAKFFYDSAKNETTVVYYAVIKNNTVFNIKNFEITFDIYNDGNFVSLTPYKFDEGVKHGKEKSGTFKITVPGKADEINFVSWSANYDSFWGTYKGWMITTIIISIALTIVTSIIICANDFDVDDLLDFFDDCKAALIPIAGVFVIWGVAFWIFSSWVPVCIVGGGILAYVLLSLGVCGIKSVID